LNDTPFTISADPTALHLTPSLQAVILRTRFTIDKRQGLSTILGDFGLGKSSLLRYLYGSYAAREDTITQLIPTPDYPTVFGLLKAICSSFEIAPKGSYQAQIKVFEEYLVAQYGAGLNVVIFVDEANVLKPDKLELFRRFLNFETHTHKLVQVVMAGQLELKARLAPSLRSRISTYSLLSPLTLPETGEMIARRCQAAGVQSPFTPKHVEEVYRLTGGIPRYVLKVCAVAYEAQLQLGYLPELEDMVGEVSAEVAA